MKEKIITYIETGLLSGQENVNLSTDEDLLTTGIIDSLGIMKLIAYLEEEFKISIPAEDMTIEYFMTVDDMSDYIVTRQSITV